MNPQLIENVKKLPTNYSTYVVAVLMALVAYWLNMAPAEQQALIASYPWLKHLAPLFGVISFVAARVLPQTKPDNVEGDEFKP